MSEREDHAAALVLQRELDALRVERAMIAEQLARHTVAAVAPAGVDEDVPDTVRVRPLPFPPPIENLGADVGTHLVLTLMAIVFVVAVAALATR